jgi:hypothetical protein
MQYALSIYEPDYARGEGMFTEVHPQATRQLPHGPTEVKATNLVGAILIFSLFMVVEKSF